MTAPAIDSSFPSHLIELGQQAIDAVAAKVAEGIAACALPAYRVRLFFEAWKRQCEASENDFERHELLNAVGIHCCRMRTAAISPATMLEELRAAVELLRIERLPASPTRARPTLRLVQGGLSR